MTALIYNLALLVGVLLVGVGVGLKSIPSAFITVGALVLVLTLVGAFMARK